MHILERIGAVAPFLDKALGWRFGRSYYRGEQIFRLEMPHPPRAKNICRCTICSSNTSKSICMTRSPPAASSTCAGRANFPASNAATTAFRSSIASPAGDYRLDADYVLAADGARSPIRSRSACGMKGDNYEGRYVIADIRMDHDFPTERRAFFEPSGNPGGTVLIHKQPENIWRVDYQLREGESEEDALREENIRARVGAILADIGHDQAVGAGMVERLFRQHALPRRLPPRPGVLHRRRRAYRADFWRARAQQWPRGCRQSRLEACARPQGRGGRNPARQLFAGAARRHARRVRQRHQEHALHDPADARLAAGARGRTVAQPEARISARPRQSPADAALHLFGKPADALSPAAMPSLRPARSAAAFRRTPNWPTAPICWIAPATA